MTLQEAAEKHADEKYGKNLVLPEACAMHDDGISDFMAGAQYRQAEVDELKEKIGRLTIENNQMRFGLELIINFDESSIYDDPGQIAKEYIAKKHPQP